MKWVCIIVASKDLYQVQERWKFFFLTHIQLSVSSYFEPSNFLLRTLQYLKQNFYIFFVIENMKKQPSKVAHNRAHFFKYCQKWPGLPRQLKTHVAVSMFSILRKVVMDAIQARNPGAQILAIWLHTDLQPVL